MTYRSAFGYSPISYTILVDGFLGRYTITNGIATIYQITPTDHNRVIGRVNVPEFGHANAVRAFLAGE
jgi:hypothetical protein